MENSTEEQDVLPNTTSNAETAVLNCNLEVKMNRYIYFNVKKNK